MVLRNVIDSDQANLATAGSTSMSGVCSAAGVSRRLIKPNQNQNHNHNQKALEDEAISSSKQDICNSNEKNEKDLMNYMVWKYLPF